MIFIITCKYCGKEEKKEFFLTPTRSSLKCEACKETKLIKIVKVESGNVFGYDEDDKKPDAYIKVDTDDKDGYDWGGD